jgi:hypothetical protein
MVGFVDGSEKLSDLVPEKEQKEHILFRQVFQNEPKQHWFGKEQFRKYESGDVIVFDGFVLVGGKMNSVLARVGIVYRRFACWKNRFGRL